MGIRLAAAGHEKVIARQSMLGVIDLALICVSAVVYGWVFYNLSIVGRLFKVDRRLKWLKFWL